MIVSQMCNISNIIINKFCQSGKELSFWKKCPFVQLISSYQIPKNQQNLFLILLIPSNKTIQYLNILNIATKLYILRNFFQIQFLRTLIYLRNLELKPFHMDKHFPQFLKSYLNLLVCAILCNILYYFQYSIINTMGNCQGTLNQNDFIQNEGPSQVVGQEDDLKIKNFKNMKIKDNNSCFESTYVQSSKSKEPSQLITEKNQKNKNFNQKQNGTNSRSNKSDMVDKKKKVPAVKRNTKDLKIKADFLQLKQKRAIDQYKLLSKIQSKRVGEVYKVLDRKTNQFRTLQILKQSNTNGQILNEIQILKGLDHHCIFHLYDLFKNKQNFYIVGQYIKGQNLLEILNLNHPYTQKQLSELIYNILLGLNYLHNSKIMHLNIKPENILFQTKYDHKATSFPPIKIINFKKAKSCQLPVQETILGNASFMSPEMLMGSLGSKCDIWSLGVILYYFISGEFPFKGNTKQQVKDKILNNQIIFNEKIWNSKTKQLVCLVGRMLQKKPTKRISAKQALASEWFQNAKANYLLTVSPQTMRNISQNIGQSKFRTLIKTYIVSMTTSQQERKLMAEKFQQFDKDNSGFIDNRQLECIFKQIFDQSQQELDIDDLMEKIDTNNSGKIDFTQFMTAISKVEVIFSKQRLEKAFDYIDYDHTGQIEANQLVSLFKSDIDENQMEEAEQQIQQILEEFDNDGDCMISKDEFTNFFLKLKTKKAD